MATILAHNDTLFSVIATLCSEEMRPISSGVATGEIRKQNPSKCSNVDFEWVWVCDDWHKVREEVTMFIITIQHVLSAVLLHYSRNLGLINF